MSTAKRRLQRRRMRRATWCHHPWKHLQGDCLRGHKGYGWYPWRQPDWRYLTEDGEPLSGWNFFV